MNINSKSGIYFIAIFIIHLIIFPLSILAQDEQNFNYITYCINDVVNLNPDFEYDYLSDMIKKIIKKSLEGKSIIFDNKLQEIYFKNILKYYSFMADFKTDFNIPVKNKEILSLNEKKYNLKYSLNPFLLLDINYKVIDKKIKKELIIEIYEKYNKNYTNNLLKSEIVKNISLDKKNTIQDKKLSLVEKDDYIIYKKFEYVIEYNSFSVYDSLIKLFQKKFLTDYLNISYSKLLIVSNKDYYLKCNGKILGSTNKEYYLENGEKELNIFLPGYKSKSININLNKDLVLNINLKKIEFNFNIVINTFPQNAEIWIDNKFIGFSPININNLDIGTHFVTVIKNGYVIKEKVIELNNFIKNKYSFKKKENNNTIDNTNNIYYLNIFLFPENSVTFYNDYANKYLNSGYKKAFISGAFAAAGIVSSILYNEFYLNYIYRYDYTSQYIANTMIVTTFLFATISLYEFIDAIITLNKYTEIKKNYNPVK